jgi:serine/threonine-protein kinase
MAAFPLSLHHSVSHCHPRPHLPADDLARLTSALADRFTIQRELGRGGMAIVYLARDRKHDRQVAIKVLRPELSAAMGSERFEREIQLVARLSHPNILQLHDSGEAAGVLYFVMPYVEGESLRQRLDREGPLPVPAAVQLASEIADALDYAHHHGVIHRDIKPENILLQTGHAVVSDFGIARAIDAATMEDLGAGSLTATGMALGTPLYMSPEQVAGGAVDGRTDVYALGCVLFEMLEGAPPFAGHSPIAVLAKHSAAPVPPFKRSRGTVSDGLEETVRKALAKSPDDRFAGAAEFRTALAGEATSLPRPVRRPPGRRPVLALGLVAATVLVTLAGYRILISRTPTGAMPSIAVLALRNIGGDSANEPFSDGVSEEITTALGKVPGLRVEARSRAFEFKNKALGPQEIGRQLHVRYVLDGGVRLGGSRRRVSVQLINVADGSEVWSDEYDRDVADRDVFAVQDSIARAIVGSLSIHLSGTARAALHSRSTENPEAHDLYLKGRAAWYQRGSGGSVALHLAIGYFEQAIKLDSSYALAWAGLADAYSMTPIFGDTPPAESFASAKAAARRAMTLDSALAGAHTSLAIIATFHDWDWATAGREFARALAIDSTEPHTHQFRGIYYGERGQYDSAEAELRTARRLDPVSPLINVRIGTLLFEARRYEEAEAALRDALLLDPGNVSARAELGLQLIARHRLPEALDIFRTLEDTTDLNRQGGLQVAGPLGYAYGVAGRRADALGIRTYLEQRARVRYIVPLALAQISVGLGDTARALDELERGYRERVALMGRIAWPMFDPLRSQRRFQRIVRDIGIVLPPSSGEGAR